MKTNGMKFGTGNNRFFSFFYPDRYYYITPFQRNYTWETDQLSGVMNDIKYLLEDDSNTVSWPNILLQENNDEESTTKDCYNIGDGQQRSVTMSLTLLAVYYNYLDLLDKIKEDEDAEQREERLKSVIEHKENKDLNRILFDENNERSDYFGWIGYGRRINENEVVFDYPIIQFFDDKVQDAYTKLFDRKKAKEIIDNKLEEENQTDALSTSVFNLQRNLKYLYEKINEEYCSCKKEEDSISNLAKIFKCLMGRIYLAVHIYDSDEDMHRAFQMMNSYGVRLSQSDLVKSSVYASVDRNLDKRDNKNSKKTKFLDDISKYWSKKFETKHWTKKASARSGRDGGSNIEVFLEQYLHSQSYTEYAGRLMDKNAMGNSLSYKWKHFMETIFKDKNKETEKESAFEEWWISFKKDFEFYSKLTSSEVIGTDKYMRTVKAIRYLFEKGSVANIDSFFLKVNRMDLPEEEKLKFLLSLLKHYNYKMVVLQGTDAAYFNLLMDTAVIKQLIDEDLNHKDFVKLLELEGAKDFWYGKDQIKERITKNRYKSNKHMNHVVGMFLYSDLIKRYNNNDVNYVCLSVIIENKKKISLEHIFPQKPKDYNGMSEEEVEIMVSKIGNMMPVTLSENSSASNNAISEKAKIYEERIKNNHYGTCSKWIQDWVNDYKNKYNHEWGKDQINARTEELAETFAEILKPENDNKINAKSIFYPELYQNLEIGGKVYIQDNDGNYHEFQQTEKGTLESTVENNGENKEIVDKIGFNDILEQFGRDTAKNKKSAWKDILLLETEEGYITFKKFLDTKKKEKHIEKTESLF